MSFGSVIIVEFLIGKLYTQSIIGSDCFQSHDVELPRGLVPSSDLPINQVLGSGIRGALLQAEYFPYDKIRRHSVAFRWNRKLTRSIN